VRKRTNARWCAQFLPTNDLCTRHGAPKSQLLRV
jgi:hypothetical protein